MRRGGELAAYLERLPQHDRAAIKEALAKGQRVEHERLAPVAARSAVARRQRLAALCFGILAPMYLTMWWVAEWLVERESDRGGGGDIAVLIGGYAILILVSLVIWVLLWRPLVQAEKVNLATGGAAGAQRAAKVASNWLVAWSLSIPILFIPSIVLDSLHISLGLGGVVLWSALVWGIRTSLERRHSW